MGKPEWGVKRQCAGCGARFYDLMHDPIVCPECGTVYEVAALVRGKRARPASGRADMLKKPILVEDAEELDIDVELEDEAEVEDDVVLDEEADEADDVAVPGGPAGSEIDIEAEDVLDTDDTVLIEDEDDDEAPLDEFGEDLEDDEGRR
jgi:uncharacterized protein (TIGR02300 family)